MRKSFLIGFACCAIVLILCAAIVQNTFTTVTPGQFPSLLPAPAATSNWFVVIHSDGDGTILESPKFAGINTNLNWNGQFGADSGKFTNALTLNGSPVLTNSSGMDTTATNIVTLTQTGTNAPQLDFSLVARGGVWKLQATNNVYFGAPANVNNTDFKKAWLAIQQPSTGTCSVKFTNGFFATPEGQTLVIDTNNGAVTWFEMVTDVFTNGQVNVWMSTKMKLTP